MSLEQPIASYDIASGAQRGVHFTLYGNRLVLTGADAMETVPLAHLASVRVAFERDAHKLHWAIGLFVVATILIALSGPLQAWMQALTESAQRGSSDDSIKSVLLASFEAIRQFARLFTPVALLLFAGTAALVFFFWLGHTTLTLAFAATERVCAVRGRNRQLMDFADLLGEQLAGRKD